MLGKLIKHDFIGSAHSIAPVYLVAAIISAVTALAFAFDIKFLKAIGAIALGIVVLCLVMITIFLTMSYFNKSLYSDQGYLTYTLPVKSRNILISKAIVSFVWMALSYLVLVGSFVLLVWYAKNKLGESLGYELEELLDMIGMLFSSSGIPTFAVITQIAFYALVYGFVTIMIIVSEAFFSMTLSNVKGFNKLGFFGGILIFVVIYIGVKIASTIIMAYVPVSLFLNSEGIGICFKSMNDVSNALGIGGFLFEAVVAVLLMFGTNFLMKKKINLR